jgi:DNA-binding transcriptional ArsR family regulator
MNAIEHMKCEQRLQRIGELLSKGITLMLSREAEARACETPRAGPLTEEAAAGAFSTPDAPGREPLTDKTMQEVLSYLERIGSASPKEIQSNLGLSRRTAARKVKQLQDAGLIVRNGHTRGVRYQVAAGANHVLAEASQTRANSSDEGTNREEHPQ